jgi:DNA polymerase
MTFTQDFPETSSLLQYYLFLDRNMNKDRRHRMLSLLGAVCHECQMCVLGEHAQEVRGHKFDPHCWSSMKVSKIMVIGQGPGLNECLEGVPFVGDSGKNFNEELARHGLTRDNFYISNTVKCYAPQNRAPTESEVSACKLFLQMEMAILRPVLIVTLGQVAFDRMCPNHDYSSSLGTISRDNGSGHVPVFAVYHPSPRNLEVPERKARFKRQMAVLCALVKKIEAGALKDSPESFS